MNTVQVGNTNRYQLTCSYGHKSLVVLDNPQFEVIFQSGISALHDGYYREAVFNFAIALERFYEFSIIYFLSNRIAHWDETFTRMNDAQFDEYESLWKSMSKQSERQIGAFYVLYFNKYEKSPPLFSAGWIKKNAGFDILIDGKKDDPVHFRNLVVHQGYVPAKDEAILYGEAVSKYIHALLIEYSEGNDNQIRLAVEAIERKLNVRKYKGTGTRVYSAIPTFIAGYSGIYLRDNPSLRDLFK